VRPTMRLDENSDVIIPVTTHNDKTYLMAVVALRTCQASTKARIWAFINNSPPSTLRNRLISQCAMLGISTVDWQRPFSLSKIFNKGLDMTNGEYIAYGTSDVIFYPDWFEKIISLWKESPDYFCLVNYSFDDLKMPCTKNHTEEIRKIQNTHNPSSGVTIFKRASGWRWDEKITLWEIDTDLNLFLERNRLKAGYCLNARCDHLINCVKDQIPESWGLSNNPRAYVEKKYGLEKPVNGSMDKT